jgi:riboflavin transporter FmnP
MQFTGQQILWVFLTPIALGTALNITLVIVLKRDILKLILSDKGGSIVRLLTLTLVVFWVGTLALADKVPASAASAIFGSILGYVFGVGVRTASPQAQPMHELEASPKELVE